MAMDAMDLQENESLVSRVLRTVIKLNRTAWEKACCGSHTDRIIEKYLCCIRPIYTPLPFEEWHGYDYVWFARGTSFHVEIMSDKLMVFDDTRETYSNGTQVIPRREEITTEYSCCGCLRMQREDDVYNRRPMGYTTLNLETLKMSEFIIDKLQEAKKRWNISKLAIFMGPPHDEERDMRKLFGEELKRANVQVDLLVLELLGDRDISVFIDLIGFKHFAIRTVMPIELTEKLLSCGFLAINGPILNWDDLKNFQGFGLLVGANDENNFPITKIFDEIERINDDLPGKFEFLGVMSSNSLNEHLLEEILKFSRSKELFYEATEVFLLGENETGPAVIVSRRINGVFFMKNDWKKWDKVLEYLHCTRVLFGYK